MAFVKKSPRMIAANIVKEDLNNSVSASYHFVFIIALSIEIISIGTYSMYMCAVYVRFKITMKIQI